jgi:hypothetical protein
MGRRFRVDRLADRIRAVRGAPLCRRGRPGIPPGEVPAHWHACRATVRRTARASSPASAAAWSELRAAHIRRGTDRRGTDFAHTDGNGAHRIRIVHSVHFGDGNHISVGCAVHNEGRYEQARRDQTDRNETHCNEACRDEADREHAGIHDCDDEAGREQAGNATHTEDSPDQLTGRGWRGYPPIRSTCSPAALARLNRSNAGPQPVVRAIVAGILASSGMLEGCGPAFELSETDGIDQPSDTNVMAGYT